MKIGVFVHSRTGNTIQVAEKLIKQLEADGHTTELHEVKASEGAEDKPDTLEFESIPAMTEYDGLVFGAPVHAFSPAPVMSAFLKKSPSLGGKTLGCFVTQAFPFPWMGGNRALGLMKSLCHQKGGKVSGAGVVNWGRSCRERLIGEVVLKLSGVFRG